MKYFMLMVFSALYMSSAAYGKECELMTKGNAMLDKGALTARTNTKAATKGTEVKTPFNP